MNEDEIKKSFAFMKGEEKPKKRLSFIRTDGSTIINGVKIPSDMPLPILVEEGVNIDGKSPVSATVSGIIDAMLYYLRSSQKTDTNYEFYKKVLLSDSSLVNRLHSASLAKAKIETSEDASLLIEILHSLLCLEDKEERYINLARGLINAIHVEQMDNALEEVISNYEDLLEKTLLSGLELYPTSYSLLFHTSDFYRNAENYEAAKKHLELLKTHHKGGEIDKLEKAIQDAEKHENDILYIYDLINLERCEDAVKKADELLQNDPKNWYALMLKAWALRILEKWEDSKKAALLSIENGGEDFAENYNELSLCEFALNNKDLAIYYAKIALDLEEESIEYATNLAMMLIEADKKDEAYNALYDACLITEDDAILQNLITLYKEKFKEDFVPPSMRKKNKDDYDNCVYEHDHNEHCHHTHEHKEGECGCLHTHEHSADDCGCRNHHAHKHTGDDCDYQHSHYHSEHCGCHDHSNNPFDKGYDCHHKHHIGTKSNNND